MRVSRKRVVLIFVTVGLIIYGLWQARSYLSGPGLWVSYPPEGARVNEERIVVKGEAINISHLMLNGRPIFTNEQGKFEEDVLLATGVSVLEIRGADKFGRERVIRRTVYHR